MKKLLILIVSVILHANTYAKSDSVDIHAVVLLDRMSDVIGDMTSCSFKLNSAVDTPMPNLGMVKEFASHQVHLKGPNKLHVQTKSSSNNHGYWYNGDIMMYYSLTYNHYGFIETPATIIETIDMVNYYFDKDIPASDFFYPTFTDDLLAHSDFVKYMGLVEVEGVACHHIVANGPEQHVQLWLSHDTFMLPVRYVVNRKVDGENIQFEGIFSEWKINPNLPDMIFEFTAPGDARRLTLVPKN